MPSKKKNELTPFALRLYMLLVKRGIDQSELASAIGKTRQNVWAYCNSQAKPDIDTLAKIAEYLGVSTDYLLCRSDLEHDDLGLSDGAREMLKILNARGALSEKRFTINHLTTDCINRVLEDLLHTKRNNAKIAEKFNTTEDPVLESVFSLIERYIRADEIKISDKSHDTAVELLKQSGININPDHINKRVILYDFLGDLMSTDMQRVYRAEGMDIIKKELEALAEKHDREIGKLTAEELLSQADGQKE